MEITIGKIVSLVLAVIYFIVAVSMLGFVAIPGMLLTLLPPLGLIWFADFLSDFTGYVGRGGSIDETSPDFLIAGFGWVALLGLPIWIFYSS